jgi:uncharacterized protein (TIGR03086 family)
VAALVCALELQLVVVQQVRNEDLELPSRSESWTVRQVLNHSVGVTRKFADFASGVTDEPHTPVGDLLGEDHRAAVHRALNDARASWGSADMSRTCRLPFGTFTADAAAGINLFDVLAHTWDVAAVIGMHLDEHLDLWTAGLDAAREVIGPTRDPLHYATELPISNTAPSMQRFLAFLGRGVHDPA